MLKKFFITLIIAILFGNLYAKNLEDDFVNYAKGTELEEKKENKIEDITDSVTFEYVKMEKENDTNIYSANKVNIAYDIKNKKQIKDFNKNIKQQSLYYMNNKTNKSTSFYLTGYCVIKNPVKIERLSAMSYLDCNFDKGNGKLAVLLVPDVYSKALIGKPLYVIFNNNPNKRYYVHGGVVMNAQQTSLNIASIVNDRKIDRYLAKTSIDSANIVTINALNYLKAKQESSKQTKVTYMKDENGDLVPIQSQETKSPKISDYIAVSTMQLISNAVKNLGDMFYEDLPYFFKIKANTMFYVDLYLSDKPQGLPNINKPTNNLIIKNPPNSKQAPTQIIIEPVKPQ